MKKDLHKIIFFSVGIIILSVLVFQSQKAQGALEVIGDSLFAKEVNIYPDNTISGYSAKALAWDNIMNAMNQTITRLTQEYAITWNENLSDLNPKHKPEGQVWKYDKVDLSLHGEIKGKGTIIVTNGNLTIDNNLSYDPLDKNSSIGFIVPNGNIYISSKVKNLVGAYYTPNEIIFE